MKTLYLVFLPLLLCIFTISTNLAQGWQQTFGTSESSKSNKILELEDGNLIVAGTDLIAGSPSQIYIKKISPNGVFLEQSNISEDQSIHLNDFIHTSDGGFLAVGQYKNNQMGIYRAYIVKTNIEMEVLWSKIDTSFSFSAANTVIELQDGSFLLAGKTNSSFPEPVASAAFMMKLNSEGEILLTKVYEDMEEDMHSDVLLETSQSEILMGGYISHPLASPGDTFLRKYDTDGNEIWRTRSHIPTVMKKIIELENNTFLIGGTVYGSGKSYISLTVIDGIGLQIWSELYSNGRRYNEMGSVVQVSDSGFVISGRNGDLIAPNNPFPEEFYDAFLLKTDELGSLISSHLIGGEEDDNFSDIIITQDGGFAMSGQSASFGEGARQTYVVKTNSECLISSTASIYPTVPVLKISPNPTKEKAIIQLEDVEVKDGKFQLFDRTGKKVQQTKFSGSTFIFKKKNLASGLYFFQILEKGKMIGKGKIVVD